ncbi:MAG TPA: endonuclease/exonuclease/phosphatase family protein [Burkholderiales bacterium]|nr:endonuclease/exonuclease/phosphatase family protein [Burkholderiales bacterium]
MTTDLATPNLLLSTPNPALVRVFPRLRVASYNIHLGIGRDGRFLPQRIAQVIAELHVDAIALQEVQLGEGGFDMLTYLAEETGYEAVAGPTLHHAIHGAYGNALLSKHPVRSVRHIDLSVNGREPRAAIDAELDCRGHALRFIATHLGLRPAERRDQITKLLRAFEEDRSMPTVLAGDLNEWFLWGRPSRWLHAYFKPTPAPNTFPSGRPIFALDRIWMRPRTLLARVRVHATGVARQASDHLPLIGELEG